jgi:hypothetical protein
MPAREKEQSKKVIELPGIAARRRRRRNAEVAEIAAEEGETPKTPDGESARDERLKRAAEKFAESVYPNTDSLSNLELTSEVTRRFALPNDKRKLSDLLKHAAAVAAPRFKALALERRRWRGILSALKKKSELEAQADRADRAALVTGEFIAYMDARRHELVRATRKYRNLHLISSEDLLAELLGRFACAGNDLGEILEIISRGVDKPTIVKAGRKERRHRNNYL